MILSIQYGMISTQKDVDVWKSGCISTWDPPVGGYAKKGGLGAPERWKAGEFVPSFLKPVPLLVHVSASLSYCLFTLSFGAYGNHLRDLQDPTSLCVTSSVAPAIRWRWCDSNARRAKVRSWDHLDHQCSVSTWECAMWGLARVVLVAQLPNSMTFELYQALACLGLERSTIQFPMEGEVGSWCGCVSQTNRCLCWSRTG